MNKLTFTLLLILSLFMRAIPQVHAQAPTCQPVYGGGEQTCVQNKDFSVNKQIQEPGGTAFFDNVTDPSKLFVQHQNVTFRITVKNTSTRALTNFTVEDTLAAPLVYIRGDGTYDSSTKLFKATIDELAPGQSKNINILSRIVLAPTPPPSPLCVSNQVEVKQANRASNDLATYCINTTAAAQPQTSPATLGTNTQNQTKGGLPVYQKSNAQKTPATGPEALAALGLIFSGLGGLYLRRITQFK